VIDFIIEAVTTLIGDLAGRGRRQRMLALEGAAIVAVLASLLVFLAVWLSWTKR